MAAGEVTLTRAEVEARIAELRQQAAIAYDSWLLTRGALTEMEFVKRRFLEAVEAAPKARETDSWPPPPSDSPQASSTSETGPGHSQA